MRAAIIGAGVIGRGWACRFLLHGWDVVVYDQDPATPGQLNKTLQQATQALHALYAPSLPGSGTLSYAESIATAVIGADWVQESLPESIELKQAVLRDIAPYLGQDVPLASSTSGYKPTALAAGLECAPQLLVCHPFNPVYLLPAVEVVGSESTRADVLTDAMSVLRHLGMFPVEVRREIDAHVADRLLEALWREALWLIKDGVATTEEIDDIMRHGFGLRWAQMGLFETYRIGGGEAGMHHFLEQFGPALAWPWSKLTDVPVMDAALIDKIARQSDAQSGHLSISELEQQRDENLVALMRALRSTNQGAGRLINDYLDPRL